MKILVIDTYYPDFLKSIPFDGASNYETELRKVLDLAFGTADFYSRALAALGSDCIDVVVNHDRLQEMWARENGISGHILRAQIEHHKPDVVFLQDASLPMGVGPYILAAQISCPWPGDKAVSKLDAAFTSFPHYLQRFRALGVRAVYLPLAFDPIVLDGPQPERDLDISFVGGVGRNSHWRSGTDTIEAVAETFQERFSWWGYGFENLPRNSPLRDCYRGSAFGRDMYAIYRRSKVVLNRHGEIAEGFANNLRVYESTGCGAMLLTDNKSEHFDSGEIVNYSSAAEAIERIEFFLANNTIRNITAQRGQRRTIRDHTYTQRMKVVAETLTEMLCPA